MANHTFAASPHKTARIAGLSYLVIIVTGILAEFLVRSRLIVSGDAGATMSNILGSESLFRASIATDLVMIGADLVVAVALYALLRPINQYLALLAAFFRVVMDAILGVNLLNLLAALALAKGGADQALSMWFIDAHALGYSIGLIPFGFGTMVIGYLLYTSKYVPRVVAVLVSLASLVYLTGSFVHILAPNVEEAFAPAYLLPVIAELALALWLSFKGVNVKISDAKRVPAIA